MEMRVVVVVRTLSAVVLAQGVFLFVGTIHCFVDQALFFKCPQSTVQGDAVYFAQLLLKVILRQSFSTSQKQVQHLHPHVGEAQLM